MRFACEVKDFEPTVAMDRKLARRTDRYCQFVLVAAREAIEDAGLDVTADGLGERTGTAVATGIGGLQTLDLAHEHLFAKGIDRMSPLWITMLIPNMGAAMVSMEYGFRGPVEHRDHRLRGLLDGDRRRRRHDPRRPRRRDGRGRHRGADHADRRRRVLRDARDLAAQRRSRDRPAGRSTPGATAS